MDHNHSALIILLEAMNEMCIKLVLTEGALKTSNTSYTYHSSFKNVVPRTTVATRNTRRSTVVTHSSAALRAMLSLQEHQDDFWCSVCRR